MTLIAERRFGNARAMLGDIQTMLQIAKLKWTDVVNVRVFQLEDTVYASVLRLWFDGETKTYTLHIL